MKFAKAVLYPAAGVAQFFIVPNRILGAIVGTMLITLGLLYAFQVAKGRDKS